MYGKSLKTCTAIHSNPKPNMKNKTAKTKAKPIDTKPKPPIKKPAKKQTKPTKARYNQPGTDVVKDTARAAIKNLRNIAMAFLLLKIKADLNREDVVEIPMDLANANLDILAAIEVSIIKQSKLEDDYADVSVEEK